MGSKVQTLPADLSIPSSYLFSLLLLLEQALLVPAIERSSVSLAKLETIATIVIMPLHCLILEPGAPVLIFPSTFLLFSYLPFNFCPTLLSYYTIVQ